MKNLFKTGDIKTYSHTVLSNEMAEFNTVQVHPFYSTFCLARDAEWSSRLFVLDMKDEDEEGIGTFIHIDHKSPALAGTEVVFTATVKSIIGNELICSIDVYAGNRLLATGETGQKIVKKEKLNTLISKLTGETGK